MSLWSSPTGLDSSIEVLHNSDKIYNKVMIIIQNTVKPANAVPSIKQSSVLKGHYFPILS
jgi:hypothetical protein